MLTFISGQPGNGKTLFTMVSVEEKRKAENRPVFYHGIPEVTLDGWTVLDDPTKWHELPEKAIIVMDEVQKVMPPRPSSSRPPQHVSELETHRHKGFDLFFMSQDPSLVDNHIKKLAGEHIHLIRQWGREKSDVFKMQKVQDPTNANLKRALRSTFPFPKEAYGWYKSADAHTHKKKLPFRYYLMFLLPVIAIVSGTFGVRLLWKIGHKDEKPAQQQQAQGQANGAPGQASSNGSKVAGPVSAAEYVASFAPRVDGLAYTAPVYDGLTKPQRVPVPAACVHIRGGCECWTQQGTHLETTQQICDMVVRRGFFEAFDPDGEKASKPLQQQQSQPAPVVQAPAPQVNVALDLSGVSAGDSRPRKRTVVGSGKVRRVDEMGVFGDEDSGG
ncbi:zonular occludens toxin [Ralstonia pickettii]|uniref:zonular occludens toxin domain-containing protein n=1 Tax=Ralstonia pickettii TaxID=329 RepID=UPI000BD038A5|nr:zonular occludens toxin domain-containing protein [Ralstonia pickettii]POH87040.1 zonular occludens toxin [Ralstonia pickettii]